MKSLRIAVVGATGLVGSTVLKYLAQKHVPASSLCLVASQKSQGLNIDYCGESLTVTALEEFDFRQTQLAFFAAGSDVARHYAPKAVTAGNWVIDKSSCFRADAAVPLVIPSLNFECIDRSRPGIIAVPNCSTIPLNMVLQPILQLYGLKRLDVATYQAVSGAGSAGVKELEEQLQAYARGAEVQAHYFQQPILHNVLASIDRLTASGYTQEELKLQYETRKILSQPNLIVNATAVRVPVIHGHSQAVSIETEAPIDIVKLNSVLGQSAHVCCMAPNELPNPLEHATDEGMVWVGRIRQLPEDALNRVSLWLVSSNLGRGAALSAVEIAERLGVICPNKIVNHLVG